MDSFICCDIFITLNVCNLFSDRPTDLAQIFNHFSKYKITHAATINIKRRMRLYRSLTVDFVEKLTFFEKLERKSAKLSSLNSSPSMRSFIIIISVFNVP